MHYLSSVYYVTISLHVTGLLVAHHQEVTMCVWNKQYVLYVLVDCQLAWLGLVTNKLKMNSASGWFHHTHLLRYIG
jgi:hypothetical protein